MGLFHRKPTEPQNPVIFNEDAALSSALQTAGLERYLSLYGKALPEDRRKDIQIKKRIAERGMEGERLTLHTLMRTPMYMIILKDLHFLYGTIPTQVDFVVITDKLIFVLETKNWNADFRIDACGDFISQDTGKRWKSPLSQNAEHMEYLSRVYQSFSRNRLDRFYSAVVWANESAVLDRSEAPEDAVETITYVKNLPNFILERYNACRLKRMKPAEMQSVAQQLLSYCEEHAASRKCPICGKDLVLRETDTPFYGCSGYRNGCRYTEQES